MENIQVFANKKPVATYLGLAFALFAMPTALAVFRLASGEIHSDLQVLARECVVFALVGLLLWLVIGWERLTLATIGLRADKFGKSLLWGLLLTAISLAATVGLYVLLSQFGVHLGSGDGNSFRPSPWVVSVVMLRAGVAEEIFYRGYAIERLQSLTHSRWLAALLPLIVFSAAHYRQGLGGIFATFVLGGVLTVFYMKRRDLVANITGHFLTDFLLNVVLPLLGD